MCELVPSSPTLPHTGGQAEKGRKRVLGRRNGMGNNLAVGKLWQPSGPSWGEPNIWV